MTIFQVKSQFFEIDNHLLIAGKLAGIAERKINNNPKSCSGPACEHTGVIVLSIFGGLLVILIVCKIILYCYQRRLSRWASRNALCFPSSRKYTPCAENVFQSGSWSARYLQLGTWVGPHSYSITFESPSFKITGSGSDDVGTFLLTGAYSKETGRILLIKTYQLGTGDPSKNFGHRVWVQLTWNEKNSQFEGKWHVRAKAVCGKGLFELKYPVDTHIWIVPAAQS